jgi:hypothetical protein
MHKSTEKSLSPESIAHLKDLALDNRVLEKDDEAMSVEELDDLEQNLAAHDSNFRSELDYTGYKSVEGYDNHEFRGNMDDEADDLEELNFLDRPEDESIDAEESAIDPQENRKQTP